MSGTIVKWSIHAHVVGEVELSTARAGLTLSITN
jgi:hypothetical protein